MTQKEMIQTIANLSNENTEAFYQELTKNGLSEDEITTIKSMVFYFKLYNDPYLYNVVVKSMGEQIYAEAHN